MKNILKVSMLMLSMFLASCSEDDNSSSNISDTNLSGMVSGDNFTATGGKAFATSFGDEEQVSINIANVSADCDSFISDYDLYVSATVLLEVGTYNDTNVAFHKEGETTLNYLGGTVVIEEITETTITVKIKADSSTENMVEGVFTVDYCE